MEEAPLFAITNYGVTIFCHRDFSIITDKRIWASPPISWNSTLLPPRAAWLHFMAIAEECRIMAVKSRLSRSQVPLTPTHEYALPLSNDGGSRLLNAACKTGSPVRGTLQTKEGRLQDDTSLDWPLRSFDVTADAAAPYFTPLECQSNWQHGQTTYLWSLLKLHLVVCL